MKHLILAPALLILAACSSDVPTSAYYNRGAPESLLDVSAEVVNLSVESEVALDEMADWIQHDQPTRAELYCPEADERCSAAQEVLDLYGVATLYVPSLDSVVSLVYERVLARDCENRYIDRIGNGSNLNHPSFGCSNAANIVQMVSDKHQFVRPNLMDPVSSYKAVKAYQKYLEPTEQFTLDDSLLDNAEIN
ncbi:MAG: CpaD family pilus assembly lipoprotein [Rickettsiales bacterium]|nr:CpaD family pilus assembly lipoprotein [Rickettsiales bacterium]